MQFRTEEYYRAGIDRLRQAKALHLEGNSYALSMYCSGLAVECLLRAFRWQADPSFEGRHDLGELLQASRILQISEEFMRRKRHTEEEIHDISRHLRAVMNEVVILWHNNLRFASESRLEAFLNRAGRTRGVKGDVRKKNSSDVLEAAHTIVTRGIALWTSRTSSPRRSELP